MKTAMRTIYSKGNRIALIVYILLCLLVSCSKNVEKQKSAIGRNGGEPALSVTEETPQVVISTAAAVGNITVSSDTAGMLLIDGVSTETRIEAGGIVTVENVPAGATEVAIQGDNGGVIAAAETVMVIQGQTVSVAVKTPAVSATPPPTTSPRASGFLRLPTRLSWFAVAPVQSKTKAPCNWFFVALSRGFCTRCLRFTNFVAKAHARLASSDLLVLSG
jgi:hypothetical protein